jgi:hypothetical protein
VKRHRHPGKIHSHSPQIEGLVPHNCCPDCPDLHSDAAAMAEDWRAVGADLDIVLMQIESLWRAGEDRQ